MRATFLIVLLTLLAGASAAKAQNAPLCSDRPGKATPSCVVAQGTIQVETSAIDWTRDRADGASSDTFLFGDTLLKYGIGGDTEVRVSLTPYIHSRTRGTGGALSAEGFGDVGLSFRHRLLDGGDGGISVAVQPAVVLPVGSDDVSSGTVSGSVTLPIDIPLPGGWSLNTTPTVAAAADADGNGRHLAYAGVVAVSHGIGANLTATGELFVQRDRDPGGRSTQATADLLLAWQPIADWQFDVSSYVGLNRTTPDLELLVGFTRRF